MTTAPDDHYCELHDWKTIGTVSTDNGMLALVAPYFAATLAEWWNASDYLPALREHRVSAHDPQQLKLRHQSWKVTNPSYEAHEDALLVPTDNGIYTVEVRHCELDHILPGPCELRIRFHVGDGYDLHDNDPEDDILAVVDEVLEDVDQP
jgi:hypothetical protein